MVGIAVDFGDECRHNLQFRVVRADLDIEILQIVLRTGPPLFGMVGDIILRADNGRFTVLRSSRTIKVQAIHPHASAIEHLAGMVFIERFRSGWEM